MPRFDVTGVGIAACDYLTQLDAFPPSDAKVRSETFEIQGGGTVGNALVTLSRLGMKAAFAGGVGEDEFGRFILDSLEQEGIDTELVQTTPGARSPFSFCVSVPPARNVFSIRPTTPPLRLDASRRKQALDCRFLHLDGAEEELSVELAREARQSGVGVSLDLQRMRPNSRALLDLADVAVVSAGFARETFGDASPDEAVRKLHRPDMQLAAITFGADGAIATDGGEPFRVAAENVKTVDTTGAGDVFHGALLTGLLLGHDVRHALRFATHVAGLSCRALGGRAGVPRREELGNDWL